MKNIYIQKHSRSTRAFISLMSKNSLNQSKTGYFVDHYDKQFKSSSSQNNLYMYNIFQYLKILILLIQWIHSQKGYYNLYMEKHLEISKKWHERCLTLIIKLGYLWGMSVKDNSPSFSLRTDVISIGWEYLTSTTDSKTYR